MRDIPNTNEIQSFMHCGECIKELPRGMSPRDYTAIECGWTPLGFQIWCKRHELNMLHVDFEGQKHPANRTAVRRKTEDFQRKEKDKKWTKT